MSNTHISPALLDIDLAAKQQQVDRSFMADKAWGKNNKVGQGYKDYLQFLLFL